MLQLGEKVKDANPTLGIILTLLGLGFSIGAVANFAFLIKNIFQSLRR
jgi:hypothetical protein